MLNLNYNILGSQKDRTERGFAPPAPPLTAQILLIGAGGNGTVDIGGGGGAGGVFISSSIRFDQNISYEINVGTASLSYYQFNAITNGQGWQTDPPNSNKGGQDSWIKNLTTSTIVARAYGGGHAGYGGGRGNNGGSGGGGAQGNIALVLGGTATYTTGSFPNIGNNGGGSTLQNGGGGGGAGISGSNGTAVTGSSIGGYGIPITIGWYSGSNQYIAAGGNGSGAINIVSGSNLITGSLGGGGKAGLYVSPSNYVLPTNGEPNTGAGGGGLKGAVPNGFTASFANTGVGGTGLAVVFYEGKQQAFGGIIETREVNGKFYTQHVFTSSAVLQISRNV